VLNIWEFILNISFVQIPDIKEEGGCKNPPLVSGGFYLKSF